MTLLHIKCLLYIIFLSIMYYVIFTTFKNIVYLEQDLFLRRIHFLKPNNKIIEKHDLSYKFDLDSFKTAVFLLRGIILHNG